MTVVKVNVTVVDLFVADGSNFEVDIVDAGPNKVVGVECAAVDRALGRIVEVEQEIILTLPLLVEQSTDTVDVMVTQLVLLGEL